jgi:hypothetical protein
MVYDKTAEAFLLNTPRGTEGRLKIERYADTALKYPDSLPLGV